MAATRDQSAYRWRNDDGGETTATWVAAVNTSISGALDTNYRIRLETTLGGTGSFTITPKLQYNKNGAGWNDVNASSSVARTFDSPHFTDELATTFQLGGGGGFAAGRMDDDNGSADLGVTLDDAGNINSEHEFCLRIRSADVTSGDQIEFRMVGAGGAAYDSYTHLGVFIVSSTYIKGQFFSFFE